MTWTKRELVAQVSRARTSGWLRFFAAAAAAHGFEPSLLLAIASRETNVRDIRGDFRNGVYHGFGIMQVDIGTNSAFCSQWRPGQVEMSIRIGAQILSDKRKALRAGGVVALNCVVAAYNAGAAAVLRARRIYGDPDRATTGRDYSSDVLARMAVFEPMLAEVVS